MIEDDDPDGDWTAPGVYRCAPGVHRIPLPLPNDGLRAVNTYAVVDGAGLTLIDPGWALTEARELLERGLAELGAGLGDVRRFLVTHVHRDHYTQAVVLRREFGMRVALGRGEQPGLDLMHSLARGGRGDGSAQRDRLWRAGAVELVEAMDRASIPPPDLTIWGMPDDWIDDGDEFTLAGPEHGRRLLAVATPGHTRGHVVFADEAGELLFSGDHVLPRITPSIGVEPVQARSPLADFLTSLDLVRGRPDARMLPAHGPVGMRVHQRVDELLAHHAKRLDETLAAVRAGRSTAQEVASVLVWTRRERRLDELDPFNTTLAILETAAHLDVLVERGALASTEQNGIACYTS